MNLQPTSVVLPSLRFSKRRVATQALLLLAFMLLMTGYNVSATSAPQTSPASSNSAATLNLQPDR